MSTSCSCLKLCSVVVALSNTSLGLHILVEGCLLMKKHLEGKGSADDFIVVYYQMSFFLIFVGLLLLIGTIQGKEKYISLYLLLSSLVWFVISTLAISYMIFYNFDTTGIKLQTAAEESNVTTTEAPLSDPAASEALVPKKSVPPHKAVGFSVGLMLIWCGQLGVYKHHGQVIEKNVINAGEIYVSFAHHMDEN